jgi:hypothetical protein
MQTSRKSDNDNNILYTKILNSILFFKKIQGIASAPFSRRPSWCLLDCQLLIFYANIIPNNAICGKCLMGVLGTDLII